MFEGAHLHMRKLLALIYLWAYNILRRHAPQQPCQERLRPLWYSGVLGFLGCFGGVSGFWGVCVCFVFLGCFRVWGCWGVLGVWGFWDVLRQLSGVSGFGVFWVYEYLGVLSV